MRDASEESSADSSQHPELPAWGDCDAFCINAYSGAGGPACGWRGTFQQAQHESNGAKLLCPRCGCATLLRIPLERAEDTGA